MDQATQLRRLAESATVIDLPPSVPTGRLSYGPDRAPETTPTSSPAPRARTSREIEAKPPAVHLQTAIAITSGKGGVGKTNLAVNIAVVAAALGRRVCLIDADLGMANADVLCNVTPRATLDDVAWSGRTLGEAIVAAPGGFKLLPGAAGIARMAALPPQRQAALLRRLAALERIADLLIIDTGAGLSAGVLNFCAAADRVVVAATPEPTSLTDAYGLIKALVKHHRSQPGEQEEERGERDVRRLNISVIMNMARSDAQARGAFRRLDRVSRTFLSVPLHLCGVVSDDDIVRQAVCERVPFTMLAPRCSASRAVVAVTQELLQCEGPQRRRSAAAPPAAPLTRRSASFFSRLLMRSRPQRQR